HAVCPQIPQTENSAAGSHANEPYVSLMPIAQYFANASFAFQGEVYSARVPKDMAEFKTGLTHRRIVENGEEAARVRHNHFEEERFLGVLQCGQINVALEIGRFRFQLLEHLFYLDFFSIHPGRQ